MIWAKKQRRDPAYVQKRIDAERELDHQRHEDDLRVVNRIADELAAARTQQQTDDDNRAFREKLTIYLLVGTVVTAGIGDVIFYLTMQDARISAEKSHSDSQQTIITNARAWLAPEEVSLEELPLKIGELIHFKLSYRNLGRQPALDMVHNENLGTFPRPDSGDWSSIALPENNTCDDLKAPEAGRTIYPSAGALGGVSQSERYEIHFTPKIIFDAPLNLASRGIYVQGCLAYETFKERHYSWYCFYLEPKPGKPFQEWIFAICPNGGKSD